MSMQKDDIKEMVLSEPKKAPWYAINKKYVPLKLMYFFFMSGQACSIVYRSVFMRHLGLSTNQTGIIWMIERVIAMIAPYLIGGITDKTRKPKVVLLVLLIGGAITLFAMYFIPPELYVKSGLGRPVSLKEISTGKTSFCLKIVCTNNATDCSLSNPHKSARSCYSNTRDIQSFQCLSIVSHLLNRTSMQQDCNASIITISNTKSSLHTCLDSIIRSNSTFDVAKQAVSADNIGKVATPTGSLPKRDSFVNIPGDIYSSNDSSNLSYLCYEADIETGAACAGFVPNPIDEYGVTFWPVTILMSVSCLTGVGIYPVLEATTFEVLGKDNRDKFGNQRLWASVGYGITSLVIGYVKDKSASATSTAGEMIDNREFLSMFVGVLVCWSCAALVSFTLPVKQEKQTSKVTLTDIKIVLKNPRALAFYGVLLFYGMTNAVRQIYLFWLAEEKLNAPSFVLGIATMIGSFMDIPFCLSAGFLIKKFGHIPLFCFGIFVYAIRISSAAIIVNYWQLLAVESLRGITWGLTWVVICSYTTKISPKGLENSTMGITQGLVRGVAFSIGALLGGVIYQAKGGDFLFLICGLANVIAAGLFGIFIFFTRKRSNDEQTLDQDGESEQMTMKNTEDAI